MFALGLALLGYGAGHEIVYELLGIAGSPAARSVHGYLPLTGFAASLLSVAGFGVAARALFARSDAGVAAPPWGLRALLAATVPAAAFVLGESAELLAAPAAYVSPLLLFALGVPVQCAIGLIAFAIARFAIRGLAEAVRILRRAHAPALRAPRRSPLHASGPRRPHALALVARLRGRAPPLSFA